MLTRLVGQDLLTAGAALDGIGVDGDGLIWLTECAALPRSPVTEMIARGRNTGLPVLAASTSAQVAADLADLTNVVVALPAQDTEDPAAGDHGTAGSGFPSALRDGEFTLTVQDPPRLVPRGFLVRARVPAAAA